MKNELKYRLGEFFCGPGGIALGAILASKSLKNDGLNLEITPCWASDYDQDTCRTYSKNVHHKPFEDDNLVFHEDVRKLDIASLPSCEGFAFGFPCNDFSIVGESKGLKGVFGPLYSYGIEYLKNHRPKWFVAENVGGITSSNEGKAFKLILKEMKSVGYKIVPHLYKFEDYGIPQARHRVIIVGIREDIDVEYKVPAPTHIGNHKTSREAIENPPIKTSTKNNELTKQNSRVEERLSFIAPGGNAWSESIPEHLRLNVKGAKLSNIYKRLNPKKPSYTVTGSGGGGTHMYHWSENRALTNRERARLQTFPDDFEFVGSKESVRKQIGMAVPPQGMAIVFQALLLSFAQKKYDFVKPKKFE